MGSIRTTKMADGTSQESWFGGWMQAAKDTSSSAYEFMKKDLSEFSCVLQQDSARAANAVKDSLTQENAVVAKDRVRQGVTTILDGITRVLTVEPDSDTEDEKITKDGPIFDRSQARLHAIQLDPGTYMNAPPTEDEDFPIWLNAFMLEERKGDISDLLVANAQVRSIYTQLVPAEVSHEKFWQHYFYRLHQFNADEQRRADLKKRADLATSCDEENLQWADDWVDFDDVKPDQVEATDSAPAPTPVSASNGPSAEASSPPTDIALPQSSENKTATDVTENLPLSNVSTPDSTSDKINAYSLTFIDPASNDSSTECDAAEGKSPVCVEKGDLIVVAPNSNTSSDNKESSSTSLDEEWEKDFDVTEEDILAAQEEADAVEDEDVDAEKSDDWENWE